MRISQGSVKGCNYRVAFAQINPDDLTAGLGQMDVLCDIDKDNAVAIVETLMQAKHRDPLMVYWLEEWNGRHWVYCVDSQQPGNSMQSAVGFALDHEGRVVRLRVDELTDRSNAH